MDGKNEGGGDGQSAGLTLPQGLVKKGRGQGEQSKAPDNDRGKDVDG